jgi:hypothetical protein
MQEAKKEVVHIRLSPEEKQQAEELAEAYGFRFTADLFREALAHVALKRPALGQKYKAKKPSTQRANDAAVFSAGT